MARRACKPCGRVTQQNKVLAVDPQPRDQETGKRIGTVLPYYQCVVCGEEVKTTFKVGLSGGAFDSRVPKGLYRGLV